MPTEEISISEPCAFCEPQKCYTASVWYGDVLLAFYTTEAARLDTEPLLGAALKALELVSIAIRPGVEDYVAPADMWRKVGNAGCLTCYWPDFIPAVSIIGSTVCLPEWGPQ